MPYRKSITTFFDILGFKELVNSKQADYIQEVLERLRSESTPSQDDRSKLDIEAMAFSDSVVRVVPLDSNGNIAFHNGLLYYELFQLACIQSYLIYEYGVFLRGAVTIADISAKDGIVFGPALIAAYELESNTAIYPRILVAPAVFDAFEAIPRLLGASHHSIEEDLHYLHHYAIEDNDGCRYINYLSATHLGEFIDVFNVLDRHFERIAEAACNAAGSERVLDKYRWCANYHNLVVESWADDEFLDLGVSKKDLILTNNEVPGVEGWKMASGKRRPDLQ